MLRTRVGYAGGTTIAPTYRSIGDHSEAIEIDFDPERIRYSELVDLFFQSHNACGRAWSRQYRSAVFPRDDEQRAVAESAAERFAEHAGKKVATGIEDYSGFTLAEDYHQKYRLRSAGPVLAEFEALFPTSEAFLASTAVTRANAFLAGYGSTAMRRDEVPLLGLSEASQGLLRPR